MAFSFTSTLRSPIGLDIGSRYIKAAQLSFARDGVGLPRLEAALVLERGEVDGPMTAEEAWRLRAVLDRRGFVGRELVVTVPGEALMTSILDLPPRESDAPLDAIAAAEMARAHRVEPEALEVAYWPLPGGESGGAAGSKKGGTAVMAAACPHEHAEALLDALEAGGFHVRGMDLEGWALCRAARPLVTVENPLLAMIDIGWRGVNFVLLYDHAVVYERMLGGTGMQALSEAVQREQMLPQPVIDHLLGRIGFAVDRTAIAPEDGRLADKLRGPLEQHFESLAQELRLSASYAIHQYPAATLDQLLLTGGGAMVRGLPEHLGTALEMTVRVLTPEPICTVAARGLDEAGQAALTVAVGLAMYPQKEAA
ncbi:MAG: pilus assembly protein PilM [Phycisphaeraceae bacterium]